MMHERMVSIRRAVVVIAPGTSYHAGVHLGITADDGVALAAEVIAPARPRCAALLAPALGVKRSFYRPLATFLADSGIACVLFDYRGQGDSPAPAGASLHDWADRDLAAVLGTLRTRWPDLPRVWLGHSMGGQLLGLVPDPPVSRAL